MGLDLNMDMTVHAMLRVAAIDGGQDTKPERSRVEAAAEALRENGFEIVRLGRFGVSVAAPAGVFESVLGARVQAGVAMSAAVEPSAASLAGLVVAIEVAAPPKSMERQAGG
jgi:hypothetical protein